MSQSDKVLTPVGRMVQGSLYDPQTKDAEGNPLKDKDGQDRVKYYFALAIQKKGESHWSQTEWGAKIFNVGKLGFPAGQFNHPGFAWKINDGDSSIPNKKGRIPKDNDGFAGHWVLNLSNGFAPKIVNANGSEVLTEEGLIKLGYYLQVFIHVESNDAIQQPGVYLNPQVVAFAGYGKEIYVGIDTKSIGFGQSPLPTGASSIPTEQGFNPQPTSATVTAPPVVPYPEILTPPLPTIHQLTDKAQGFTYDQLISAGWTHDLLIKHGMIIA